MKGLFDTHAHLQDERFGDLDEVLARAGKAGVGGILVCGWDLASSRDAIAMAGRHEILFAAAGFQPHDTCDLTPADFDALAALLREPGVVAVGEIGLDFHWDGVDHDRQREALDAQLALAIEHRLPVSVHSRDAEDAIYPHLAAYAARSPLTADGRPPGIMHCFGGSLAQAHLYAELGFLVSLSCAVTYPKNEAGRAIARELPLTSLVIETDSPYLPPQGRRGQRNEPAYVGAAAMAIASARGIEVDEVVAATTGNALRVFGRGEMMTAEVAA